MKYIIFFLILTSCIYCDSLQLNSATKDNGNIAIEVKLPESLDGKVWDTYMYYTIDNNRYYITLNGNSTERQVLGMLPQQIELSAQNWASKTLRVTVEIYKSNSNDLLATSQCESAILSRKNIANENPQIQFVQKFSDEKSRWYTNYKQFDSKWKYDKMGQYGGTTIGKDGCAMSSAANIINWTPRDLNSRLKGNGGYQNNLIIWTKVPYLSYAGKKSLSSSLFSSYHVIAYVGGHFVLLTGAKSGGYGSHDPGKSSNPVYSPGQIYSTRCYSK
ncbi:hypothetical protein [Candidatus Uabimicrobium sp. HlEnr_7]|uniref:hypothetical protein n=1 Tax=Candidatus Uabimicrobium helgolandensis TaxID=3095367 RepID=UPI003557ECD7